MMIRKAIRAVFVVCLVAIGLALPSLPLTGRSVLVWLQQEGIRLTAISDKWREEQPIKPEKAKAKEEAARLAGKSSGSPPTPVGENARGCRPGEDALATIPHREHYQMLAECIKVIGSVRSEPHSDQDGVQFDFDPESAYAHLFAPEESEVETGQTHQLAKPVVGLGVIVPADLPGCHPGQPIRRGATEPGAAGVCSGLDVIVPSPGTRVKITGAFVFDRENKVHVICPVWSIVPLPD
jgi:hypothetical protein